MLSKITSLQNPLVKHLVKLRQNRDYRYEHQSVLLVGIKQIQEVCRDYPTKCLLTVSEQILPKGLKTKNVFLVDEAVMKKITGLQNPEGLAAEVPMPKPLLLKRVKRLVAFEKLNDPGNLGTLIRTALALGWDGIFVIDESCDPYNEKALRASKGAIFRIPIGFGGWKDLEKIIKNNGLKPLAADMHGVSMDELYITNGVLLVLGNEAHGISTEAKAICQPVTIPMSGKMESLNVAIAGGIFMYFLNKSCVNK